MYQRLVLVGNLGRDPEMRYSPNGTAVTTFSIATSRKWTDASGQLKEETAWWRISVFGKQAETCNQYLAKGSRVLVEGELAVDEKTGGPRVYQRKDGTYGASFEVRGNLVRFMTPKSQTPDNGMSTASPIGSGGGSMSEEELPF
jgi:single-strand DNA-binding protein